MFYAYLVPWFVAVWTASTFAFYEQTFAYTKRRFNLNYDAGFDTRYWVLVGALVL
jgi:hypothetical protein